MAIRLVIRNSAGDIIRKVGRIRQLWAHPKRILIGIGTILRADTETYQFATGGNPPFAPLSPAYERQKIKRYGLQPILTASGNMRQRLRADVLGEKLTVGVWSPVTVGKKRWNLLLLHARGTTKMPKRDVGQKILKSTARRILQLIKDLTEGKRSNE